MGDDKEMKQEANKTIQGDVKELKKKFRQWRYVQKDHPLTQKYHEVSKKPKLVSLSQFSCSTAY